MEKILAQLFSFGFALLAAGLCVAGIRPKSSQRGGRSRRNRFALAIQRTRSRLMSPPRKRGSTVSGGVADL